MRNQYKVLAEKYNLEVEARTSPQVKAIYNAKALTKDFLPTAIKIYKSQAESIIKSWPDFDIMTDANFSLNILTDHGHYHGTYATHHAAWAHINIYGLDPKTVPYGNVNAILERWFVYYLYEQLYEGGRPRNFYEWLNITIPPQKSNADFIQYLIDITLDRMRLYYNINHEEAKESGALEDFKKAQNIYKQGTQATGGDWNIGGLGESTSIDKMAKYAEIIVLAAKQIANDNLAKYTSDPIRAKLQPSFYWPKPSSGDTIEDVYRSFTVAIKAVITFDLYNGTLTPVPGTFKKTKYNPQVIGSMQSNNQFIPGNLNSPEALIKIEEICRDRGFRALVGKIYEIFSKSDILNITMGGVLPKEVFDLITKFVSGDLELIKSYEKAKDIYKQGTQDTGGDWDIGGLT